MSEFEASDYCRRCGRVKSEHVQHRDNKPPHCPDVAEPLEDVHHARHLQLHKMLDEMVADWMVHTDKRPSTGTVLELMQWSHGQCLRPTPTPKR